MAKDKKVGGVEALIKKHGAISGPQYEQFIGSLPVLSTGVFPVDLAIGKMCPLTGVGGLRARDMMEVCGRPGNGKTALANSMIRTTQQRYPGKSVVGLFSEPPDTDRMRREGIDVDNLIILGCYHEEAKARELMAESLLEAILEFAADADIKLIVIDSVATLMTSPQDEKELTEYSAPAELARVFNRFAAKFVRTSKVAPLVLVNHYREPIQIGFSSVPPSILDLSTPGGKTKDFLSMVRIIATAKPQWRDDGKTLHSETGKKIQDGLDVTYTLFRNKYSNKDNYRTVKAVIDFNEARFNSEELTLFYANHFTQLNAKGEMTSVLTPPVIQKGSWYYIGDKACQGMGNAVKYLKENPGITKALQAQIMPRSGEFFSDESTFSVDEELDS